MTFELWYWIILGILCVVPFLIALYMMARTQKLWPSFIYSSATGAIMTGVACLWWLAANEDPFTIRLGVIFYVIAIVNVAVLVLFALMSIQKHPPEAPKVNE